MSQFSSAREHGDHHRDYLVTDKCSMSRLLATWHIEDLQVFNATLERFIAAEDQRIASTYDGPPEDYDGWWIQDIVGNNLRRAFVCACMDATSFHLEHFPN